MLSIIKFSLGVIGEFRNHSGVYIPLYFRYMLDSYMYLFVNAIRIEIDTPK